MATLRDAQRELLGNALGVVEQLDAASAVAVAGPDAVRVYAALAAEEAAVREEAGDHSSAFLCARRALELYSALDAAGVRLDGEESEIRARLEAAGLA